MKEVKQEVGSNEEISIQRTNLRSPGKVIHTSLFYRHWMAVNEVFM